MWNERFLFVGSALSAFVFWAIIGITRRVTARWLAWLFTASIVIFMLTFHIGLNWHERSFPDSGTVLVAIIGAAVGSFSAKYIVTLFEPSFGRQNPLIGVSILLLLSVVYSLPLYEREFSVLLGDIGISTLKTPFVELTFGNEGSGRGHQGSISASGGSTGSQPQAISRLSDPTPGLTWLRQDVDDERNSTLDVDREYIAYLEKAAPDEAFQAYILSVLTQTRNFLRPIKALSKCLSAYTSVIPDSQLLVVDVKPVISYLFRIHSTTKLEFEGYTANRQKPDRYGYRYPSEQQAGIADNVKRALKSIRRSLTGDEDWKMPELAVPANKFPSLVDLIISGAAAVRPDLTIQARSKRDHALERIAPLLVKWPSAHRPEVALESENVTPPDGVLYLGRSDVTSLVYAVMQDAMMPLADDRLSSLDVGKVAGYIFVHWPKENMVHADAMDEYSKFSACDERGADWEAMDYGSSVPDYFFQPYTTLALSDLLLAHGAPDEAIAVLTEWLSRWPETRDAVRVTNSDPVNALDSRDIIGHPAAYLPEWFRFRVAARIALLLSDLGGQNNRAFRDFMGYYASGLAKYVSDADPRLNLNQINDICKTWINPGNEQSVANSARGQRKRSIEMERRVEWLLVSNENDYLRTDANFLSEEDSSEALEALQRRASFLAGVGPECLPLSGQFADPEFRLATVGSFRVTAGLVALAVAERMGALAKSPGDRNRSEEARREGEGWLRKGWGDLKPAVSLQREVLRNRPWSERVFSQSIWEDSASLATRALSRLPGSGE
jgi:hypothetical protein